MILQEGEYICPEISYLKDTRGIWSYRELDDEDTEISIGDRN